MFFAVNNFSDGVFLGQVNVTGFILDHSPGKLVGRAGRFCPPLGSKEKAEDKIDDISDEDVKDEFEKAANHPLNLPDFYICVKH
jgi:hypothetical protein